MATRRALSDKTNQSESSSSATLGKSDRSKLLAEWKAKKKQQQQGQQNASGADAGSSGGSTLGAGSSALAKRGRGLLGLSGGVRRNVTKDEEGTNKRQRTMSGSRSNGGNGNDDDAGRSQRFQSLAAKAKSFGSSSRGVRQSTPKKEKNEMSNSGPRTLEQINSQYANQPPTPPAATSMKKTISFSSKTPEQLGSHMKPKKTSFSDSNDSAHSVDSTSNSLSQDSNSNYSNTDTAAHKININDEEDDSHLLAVTEEDLDTTGDVSSKVIGLKSRLSAMSKKITKLEEEKMALSMAKAPLEARFRQREDQFKKETDALKKEISSLKQQITMADEKFRHLQLQKDKADEENTKLTLENRKMGGAVGKEERENKENQSSDGWARQLQNDRDVADLKEKLKNAEDEIDGLKLDKVSLESDVQATAMELERMEKRFGDMKAQSDGIEEARNAARDAEIRLDALTKEHVATSAMLNATSSDLAATKSSADAAMKEAENAWKEQEKQLRFEISVMKSRGGNVSEDDLKMSDDVEDEAVLRARIEERDRKIAELEADLSKGEQIRRKMHNRIQELRGNIRVFVRTRPFLPGDGNETESAINVSPDGETLEVFDKSGKANSNFNFDKVFGQSTGQDKVFEEVSEFVQSALDGYHVCLFSYGQTGSGKTHTMQGSGSGQMRGIIPRAVEQILQQAKHLQNQNWTYRMTASFLEIYNEELKDLLINVDGSGNAINTTKKAVDNNKKIAKLAIKRDADGKSFVDNLNAVNIDTTDIQMGMQQLDSVMQSAARSRSVACTNMNAQSSRSHSVFMLHLYGHNSETGTVMQGALNLCDLAGSERLDRSGAGADAKRLKETQAINKSLSCLGDVFSSLASGSSHVPYRNSKLTYLLQDCLSGDGKALMFVNLSPTMLSSHESLCSLRFAQRVSQVELGKPTKNVQYSMSNGNGNGNGSSGGMGGTRGRR